MSIFSLFKDPKTVDSVLRDMQRSVDELEQIRERELEDAEVHEQDARQSAAYAEAARREASRAAQSIDCVRELMSSAPYNVSKR